MSNFLKNNIDTVRLATSLYIGALIFRVGNSIDLVVFELSCRDILAEEH